MSKVGALAALFAVHPFAVEAAEVEKSVHIESPRSASVEFKMGAYKPLIQRESGLSSNPYEETFGSGAMLLATLEIDKMVYQGIGQVAIGFSIGYAEKFARASLVIDPAQPPAQSNDNTSLKVVPLKLLAIYKFDYMALHLGIPFTPYVKAGLLLTPWWSAKSGNIQEVSGGRSSGARWGYGFTAGLALLLDWFEPRLARDFDVGVGVNHTYLFAEYNYENVNNFGRPGLDLSGRYFMFGIAFEF